MVAKRKRPSTPEGAACAYGRILRGLDQEDLAAKMTNATSEPWTNSRVSRLERGEYRPRGYEVSRLAEVLNLPVEFFIDPSATLGGSVDPGLLSSATAPPFVAEAARATPPLAELAA